MADLDCRLQTQPRTVLIMYGTVILVICFGSLMRLRGVAA